MLDKEEFAILQSVEDWVMEQCNSWRDHFDNNYQDKFEEYNRLWRGQFSAEDKTRDSERSQIISPALQQAVESSVAEIEEATFGRGRFFDIKDDLMDGEPQDVVFLREQLYRDFQQNKARKGVAECLINAAVYGTGVAEIVLQEEKEMKPASQPIMEGQMQAVGVNIADRTVCKLRPILPQNFLIDPVATSIEEAIGVAVDEFVPYHQVELLQESGVYKDVDITLAYNDTDLDPDPELIDQPDNKVRLTKYYGLVPKYLVEDEEDFEIEEEDGHYIECIIVIANGGTLLKVERNPYMMGDRPIVAFPWDIVPGRFWGRGVCEKGYNSQKALDAELRARIDALALTVHPMMAMDASRMPRGSLLEVRPGKTILTNGNPAEILQPFKFGALDQVTFNQAGDLMKMVQMATGAIDAAGIPGSINGDAAAGAVSMSLGAIIKRHKRTLINFHENFLIPMIQKTAWRYMQYDPDNYPVQDFKFVPSSTLGVIAREYEVTQLVQLLQTLGQDSPMYPMLVMSVIDNMGLSNREELMAQLQQMMQPNPEAQQAQQQQLQLQLAAAQAQVQLLQSQTQENSARAQKYLVEAQVEPQVAQAKLAAALATNLEDGGADDKEFERRAKIAELMLKEKDIDSNERIAMTQMAGKMQQ